MSVYLRGTCDKKHRHSGECKRWYYDFRLRGVRYRGALPEAKTKQKTEQAEAVIRSEMFSGRFGEMKQTPTLKEFFDKTYLPWAKTNKKSWKDDEKRWKPIKAYFKSKRLSEISPFDLERFKKVRRETPTKFDTKEKPRPRTNATVNRELALLSKVLSLAIDAGHIKENPSKRVKKLKEDNERIRFLSSDEEARLLAELKGNELINVIVVFALNTGMKQGEIFSLRWNEIDWSRNLIHVIQTKTSKNRVVPINDAARDVLRFQQRKQAKKASELVFPSPRTSVRLVKLHKGFVKACEEAGVLDFHFHDLRHTFASRLAESGADAFTIAELLGHSKLEMTKRYTHVTDSRKRDAVAALNKPQPSNSGNVVTIWSQDEKRQAG